MYRRRLSFISLLLILTLSYAHIAQTARRPLKLDDMNRFRNVSDPQISPDGSRVAFVRVTVNEKKDGYNTAIWTVTTASETVTTYDLDIRYLNRVRTESVVALPHWRPSPRLRAVPRRHGATGADHADTASCNS